MRRAIPALVIGALLLAAAPVVHGASALDVLFDEGLHSDDGTVQDRAIALFRKVINPSRVARVRALLAEGEERLAVLAIEYLVKFKDQASIPALVKKAEDLNATISERSKAIWALGEFGATRYADKLVDVLEVAVRTNKRLLARTTITTLAKLGAKGTLPKLLELYQDDYKRRDYGAYLEPAILTLGGAEHLETIQKNNTSGQYAGLTLQAIAVFDKPLAIEEYFKHAEPTLWRQDTGNYSAFIGNSCDVSCLRLLKDKAQKTGGLHPNFFKELATLVERLGNASNAKHLFPLLRNENPEVKRAAAGALAALGGGKAATQLRHAFGGERELETKVMFAEALARASASEALRAFASGLRSGDDATRKATVATLERADTPLAAQALVDALTAKSPKVREDAATGLGKVSEGPGGPELQIALGRERHDAVRAAIIRSLGRLKYKLALRKILGHIGRRNPKALRIAALDAAAEIGGKPIFAPVSKLVRSKRFTKDCDIPKLKAAAYRALGASGQSGAARVLRDVLENYPALCWEFPAEVRAAAVDALGALGDRKAVDTLLKLEGKLKERDRETIGDAIIRALAAIGGKKADRVVLEVADGVTFNLNAYRAMAAESRFRERAAAGLTSYYLQTDLTTAPEVESFVVGFLTDFFSPGGQKQSKPRRPKRRRGRR